MSTNVEDAAPEHVGLVDDATLLQPPSGGGVASLADAVARFRGRSGHAEGRPAGSLVVPDPLLPALADVLAGSTTDALPVTLVVSGGAGGIEPAVAWAGRCPGAEVRTVSTTLRDLDDLPGVARRTVAAAEQVSFGVPDASVSVGLPLEGVGRPGWLAALDEVAMADLVVSFPTGGLSPVSPAAVVEAVDAALDREVPMRFTGPGSRFSPRTLLVVVRLVLDGERDAAVALLESRDPEATRLHERDLGSDALVRTRRWIRSVEALLP